MTPDGGGGTGGLARLLSEPPERLWPDKVVHHGARALLLVAVAILVTLLFPPAQRLDVARYEAGTVADETVQATVPFAVPKSDQELQRDRSEAAASVPATFERRPSAADSMVAHLNDFFARLDSAAETGGVEAVERIFAATPDQLELLTEEDARERLESAALRVARELLPRGFIDASQAQEITTNRITVSTGDGEERSVPTDSLLIGREFLDRAMAFFMSESPDGEDLFRLLLIRFVEPTHVVDPVTTERDKAAARRSVPTTKEDVLAGQVIVREGDLIGDSEVERLNAYTEQLRAEGLLEPQGLELATVAGAGILHLLILAIFGLYLYFFRPDVYANFRWLVLLALLGSTYFGAAAIIDGQQWPPELLPIAFASLSVAVLWDGRMALALALTLGIVTGALQPFADYRLVALTMLGGAAAALAVRVIRRRAQTWIFVAVIGAAYTAGTLAFFLMQGLEPVDTAVDLAWLLGNGTVSAILAMGFIPVFEWFTGITTDQTLLEWADPNRPLLRRLALEAPGTYAHTINVANIAEAAAGAIGANGLLCRVGIYYHDVGKILKPQYFVENQPGGRNPHDKLKPDTSASIVREHITEGYRLAKEAGVPDVIAGFVLEHHGTQKIGFFWEKAKEEHDEDELDPEQFRYPGPRPRSKETAIAMLADSVESATRALQDPTAERTRHLVRNIVDGKIEAGQLDEAPLTLKEIATLEEQFTKILSGMYHHRIDYPATRHLTESSPGGAEERLEGEAGEAGAAEAADEGARLPKEGGADDADADVPGEETSSAGVEAVAAEGRRDGQGRRASEKGS